MEGLWEALLGRGFAPKAQNGAFVTRMMISPSLWKGPWFSFLITLLNPAAAHEGFHF